MQASDFCTHYHELNERLAVSALGPSAAEAHGILCAMLCTGEPQAAESWIAELLADAAADRSTADPSTWACQRSLQDLAARTRTGIADPYLGFTPLLPEDSAPLAERAVALYDWSRGFLYGLGLAGMDVSQFSGPVREVCDDFAAITHLDLKDLDDSEENEQALTELTEFVRVAVMLVYEEQCPVAGVGR
ncbi:UPF0149 family protein [Candidatus Thiosymbion oneisti]|uniref:UPF0149 family protein n=1 Tax=Candidatus Thiosymbion oneisti TaxID=589554 RepID=UPI000B7F34ED|nr:UPF0149 family protein [Candidatus Thiosymbion oneisti]